MTGARRASGDRVVGVDTDAGPHHGRRRRHRHRRVDEQAARRAGHRRQDRHRAAAGAGHRATPARHPTRRVRAAGRQAVRAVHATSRRGTSTTSWRRTRSRPGNWMLQLVVAARQRRDADRLPDGLPGRADPRRHAQADCTTPRWRSSTTSPGCATSPSTACGRACCRSRPTSIPIVDEVRPGSVPRRRPHLRQRRRTDHRQAASARCSPGRQPEIDMSPCRWDRALESVAAGDLVHW